MFAFNQWRQAIGCRSIAAISAACLPVFALTVIALPCLGASLADPPAPPTADEVLLISTRGLGTSCVPGRMKLELDCRRLTFNTAGEPLWVAYDWHNLQKPVDAQRQTVIYVHGNRVSSGYDATEGMVVYQSLITGQSLISGRSSHKPLRYIIWSWPSAQIPGQIKDYQVKALRTNPVAWQLAWFIDQLPVETPIALMGYSYGARAVSGAMHLLGGGSLGNLQLEERQHPDRPPVRVALMAAAFDADWMLPGEMHERTITQVERMVVVTNKQDPAMRFFKLSTKHSRVEALGLAGMPQNAKLGPAAKRIEYLDVTAKVGRSHVIYDYLADTPKMNRMWDQLLDENQNLTVPAYAHLQAENARK